MATAAPESLLHLRGSFAGNQGITVSDIATDDPAFRFYSKSTTRWGVISSTANGEFIIRQLDSNWMTAPNGYHFSIVAGTGNVGIGLQPADLPPTQKLDVKGTARLRAMPFGSGTPVVADANGFSSRESRASGTRPMSVICRSILNKSSRWSRCASSGSRPARRTSA